MTPSKTFRHLVILTAIATTFGCRPQQPFYLGEDGDLSHYIDQATKIEYPDTEVPPLDEVEGTQEPLTLGHSDPKEMWDLSLEDAVRITLENSKVMRTITSLGGAPESLTRSPETAATVYGPALTESDPRYGVEAALSAFDTMFTTSVFWEKNDTPRNTFAFVDDPDDPSDIQSAFPSVLLQDLGNFQTRLQKTAATGTTWSLAHNVVYDFENTARQMPADWNVNLEAEFNHPLLQGGGVQFNRIAGPGAIPGFNNGVIIARLNTDIALADFENSVQSLVSDVETAYWNLYLAYRELQAVIAGRDAALVSWRKTRVKYETKTGKSAGDKEAQARAQYFLFKSQVESRLSTLYAVENNLRYIMGLSASDGRLIRPLDAPTHAKVEFDWCEIQSEALVRNIPLRRQRWSVKKSEMALIAAKNYLLPRLDAVGRYRWLGLGAKLVDGVNPDPRHSAYQNLTSGRYQEWHLGLDLSIPLGLRKEHAGVRNAQLDLAKERTILQEQELEVTHQLAQAVRDLDRGFQVTQTNYSRRIAAEREVACVEAAEEFGTASWDLVLQSQRRRAEADIEYYRTLVDYNLSIMEVHERKGSLLEYNGVFLAEGPWPGKAYFDANRRARARDAAVYLDYGFTRPKVLSRGEYNQSAGADYGTLAPNGQMDAQGTPTLAPMETIPVPSPESDTELFQEPGIEPLESLDGADDQTSLGRPSGFQRVRKAASGVPMAWRSKKSASESTEHENTERVAVASRPSAPIREEEASASDVTRVSHQAPIRPRPEPVEAETAPRTAKATGWRAAIR